MKLFTLEIEHGINGSTMTINDDDSRQSICEHIPTMRRAERLTKRSNEEYIAAYRLMAASKELLQCLAKEILNSMEAIEHLTMGGLGLDAFDDSIRVIAKATGRKPEDVTLEVLKEIASGK